MGYQKASLSTYDQYLADLGTPSKEEKNERDDRLIRFPCSALLLLSYPEMDFANRWCWGEFGPINGECREYQSEYPGCNLTYPHSHDGIWTAVWLLKVDYDYGYNEWYFRDDKCLERFIKFIPDISWGENHE